VASHESSPRPHRPHKDTGRGERNKPQPRTAVGRALHALLLVVFLAFSAVAQQPDVIADATNGNAGSRLLLEASDADDASLDIDAFNVEGELDLVDELGPRRALLDKKKGGSSGSKSKGSYGGDTRLCDSSKTHS
jgi:hypothetical protein